MALYKRIIENGENKLQILNKTLENKPMKGKSTFFKAQGYNQLELAYSVPTGDLVNWCSVDETIF